jgi:light-regulated signal transduction histidine kinase (bacteriophytochrome)
LLKLVNTLLDFSRLEAGRVDASFQPTDLCELTIDLASTFRSAVERAGLRFEVECDPLAERVYVDRQMWEKIVLNLLSNALSSPSRALSGSGCVPSAAAPSWWCRTPAAASRRSSCLGSSSGSTG